MEVRCRSEIGIEAGGDDDGGDGGVGRCCVDSGVVGWG